MQNDKNNTTLQATTINDIFLNANQNVTYQDLKLGYDTKHYNQIKDGKIVGYLVVSQDETRYNVISLDGKVQYFEN